MSATKALNYINEISYMCNGNCLSSANIFGKAIREYFLNINRSLKPEIAEFLKAILDRFRGIDIPTKEEGIKFIDGLDSCNIEKRSYVRFIHFECYLYMYDKKKLQNIDFDIINNVIDIVGTNYIDKLEEEEPYYIPPITKGKCMLIAAIWALRYAIDGATSE
jgi:hypothetical protein